MNIEQLRLGDIIALEVPRHGIVNRIERAFVRYGHVAIYVGGGDIVESVGRGAIRTGLLDNYLGRPSAILRYRGGYGWEGPNAAAAAIHISRQQSAKYDYKALVDYAVPRVLAQWLGLRIPRVWRDNSHYICSELVLQAYHDAGVDLGCTPPHQIVLPGDFLLSPVLQTVYMGDLR